MRFRHRRFGGAGRRPKEPVAQDRRLVSNAGGAANQNIFGSSVPAILTLFNPTDVIAGMQDLRLTLRRLRFSLTGSYVVTHNGAATDTFICYFGVALTTLNENADPSIISALGQRDDWMVLFQDEITGASPVTRILTGPLLRNIENQLYLFDLRTQRKLEQDELVQLYMQISNQNQAGGSRSLADQTKNATAATANMVATVSAVYSRTMRR